MYNEKKLTDIFKEICRNKILAFRWRAAFEMNNKDRGILGFLETHSKSESVSFHMPGHKNGKIFKRIGYSQEEILNPQFDITEIEGADNLFEPEGIIRETMDKFKKIYESRESFLLTNGSSAGLIASLLATVPLGGKVIVARNSHKSVFNALELGEMKPVYVYPEKYREYDIPAEITPNSIRKAFEENPDVKAVILASPNYYGITSKISEISKIVHEYGATLIVDQAHGAHLKFFKPELAAENGGADIVVVSTHKTLTSFTQSAILNVYGDNVNIASIASKLELIQSTSSSYLLMNSLDLCADIIEKHGKELFSEWESAIDDFKRTAIWIKGFLFMMDDSHLDDTKINLDATFLGLSGKQLANELEKRNIYPELCDGPICMCMTGIGNDRNDYLKLLTAMQEISNERIDDAMEREKQAEIDKYREGEEISYLAQTAMLALEGGDKVTLDEIERRLSVLFGEDEDDQNENTVPWGSVLPAQNIDWQELSKSEIESVPLGKATGRRVASSLSPYPPGVPIVAKGESIGKNVIEMLVQMKNDGRKIVGLRENDTVLVYKR